MQPPTYLQTGATPQCSLNPVAWGGLINGPIGITISPFSTIVGANGGIGTLFEVSPSKGANIQLASLLVDNTNDSPTMIVGNGNLFNVAFLSVSNGFSLIFNDDGSNTYNKLTSSVSTLSPPPPLSPPPLSPSPPPPHSSSPPLSHSPPPSPFGPVSGYIGPIVSVDSPGSTIGTYICVNQTVAQCAAECTASWGKDCIGFVFVESGSLAPGGPLRPACYAKQFLNNTQPIAAGNVGALYVLNGKSYSSGGH